MTPGPANRLITIEEIIKILPHRFPFLLVDRVVSLDPGKSIVAYKNVSCNESFFQGHFPEIKIMPGVLIVEALAQAGGILLYHSFTDPRKKLVVLSKIQNIKFRRSVVPGDQLRMEASVLRVTRGIWKFAVKGTVEGQTACEAELMCTLKEL